jgi:hypothetical protein
MLSMVNVFTNCQQRSINKTFAACFLFIFFQIHLTAFFRHFKTWNNPASSGKIVAEIAHFASQYFSLAQMFDFHK